MPVNKENLALVRQSFASSSLGHKVQEVASGRKEGKAKKIDAWNITIVSGVIISLGLQSVIPGNPLVFTYLGLTLSVLEIILLIVQLKLNNEKESIVHKNTAHMYMGLRDKYRLLIADILNGTLSDRDAARQRNELQSEYQTISSLAPQTTDKDYDEAMQRLTLVKDQQNAWSDKQIDKLLPKELRLK